MPKDESMSLRRGTSTKTSLGICAKWHLGALIYRRRTLKFGCEKYRRWGWVGGLPPRLNHCDWHI